MVRPFLWYQGQGHLPRSKSNLEVTFKKKKNGNYGSISFSKTHFLFMYKYNWCYHRAVT